MNTLRAITGLLVCTSMGAAFAANAQTPAASAPAAVAAASAAGQRPAGKNNAAAGERCEAAVDENVRRLRGKDVSDVRFNGAKRAAVPGADDEIGVQGEGQYRTAAGGTSFSYSCIYNTATGATSGVVLREQGGRAAAAAASLSNWSPDIAHVSAEACQSAIASSLKQKFPRVGRIEFDPTSRKLTPGAQERTNLEGLGAVQHAQGMNAVTFRYRCEFERGSSRVLNVQTSEALSGRFE